MKLYAVRNSDSCSSDSVLVRRRCRPYLIWCPPKPTTFIWGLWSLDSLLDHSSLGIQVGYFSPVRSEAVIQAGNVRAGSGCESQFKLIWKHSFEALPDMSASFVSSGSGSENVEESSDDTSSVGVFDYRVGENRSGPLEGVVPVFMLGDKSPRSVITYEDLEGLRVTYAIPSYASLAAPSDLERPDWFYPGWAVMYECFLQMGARFPLPRLVFEACTHYHIAPSQLVPNVWRILMAIQVFSELRGVHFSFSEVLLAYSLEAHRNDKVRYQFKANCPLVLSLPDGAKDWSSKYFFISNNALGEPRDSIIPHSWEACNCLRRGPTSLSFDSRGKIEWFLDFSEEDRRFSNILTEENLRASSLWSHVPAGHRMSKPPKSLPPLLGPEGAMARFRNRKKKDVSSSGVSDERAVVALPPPPSQTRKKEKRLAQTNLSQTDYLDDFIRLSFPNVAAHSQFESVRGVAEQLLFPSDREALKVMGDRDVATTLFDQSFMNMQKVAFLRERILAMAAELEGLKAEKANWRKEMTAVKKAHAEADRIIKQLELAKLEDARRAAAECQSLEEKVKQLEEQVKDVGCDVEIITRGLMAQEFLKIEPPQTWDVAQYLAEFEEWKNENPDWVAQFGKTT